MTVQQAQQSSVLERQPQAQEDIAWAVDALGIDVGSVAATERLPAIPTSHKEYVGKGIRRLLTSAAAVGTAAVALVGFTGNPDTKEPRGSVREATIAPETDPTSCNVPVAVDQMFAEMAAEHGTPQVTPDMYLINDSAADALHTEDRGNGAFAGETAYTPEQYGQHLLETDEGSTKAREVTLASLSKENQDEVLAGDSSDFVKLTFTRGMKYDGNAVQSGDGVSYGRGREVGPADIVFLHIDQEQGAACDVNLEASGRGDCGNPTFEIITPGPVPVPQETPPEETPPGPPGRLVLKEDDTNVPLQPGSGAGGVPEAFPGENNGASPETGCNGPCDGQGTEPKPVGTAPPAGETVVAPAPTPESGEEHPVPITQPQW